MLVSKQFGVYAQEYAIGKKATVLCFTVQALVVFNRDARADRDDDDRNGLGTSFQAWAPPKANQIMGATRPKQLRLSVRATCILQINSSMMFSQHYDRV